MQLLLSAVGISSGHRDSLFYIPVILKVGKLRQRDCFWFEATLALIVSTGQIGLSNIKLSHKKKGAGEKLTGKEEYHFKSHRDIQLLSKRSGSSWEKGVFIVVKN